MKGRSLQSKFCVAVVLVIMALCLWNIKASAAPKLMQVYTQEEEPSVLWNIKDVGNIESGYAVTNGEERKTPYAVIEGQECEISFAGEVGSSDGIAMNTVILLDNSLSISEQNREKAINIITQLIQNHMVNETFDLYTFSDTLNMVAENSSDYDSLINTVSGITFNDQNSYMLNALNELVNKLRSRTYENGYVYTRIILVSDGVDDDKLGLTFDEVNNNLVSSSLVFPVYTLASVWEKNESGLKSLGQMSRNTSAISFLLDDYSTDNLSQIIQRIQEDSKVWYFAFSIPLDLKNSIRTIDLYLSTDSGDCTVSSKTAIPRRSVEEEQQYQEWLLQLETDMELEPETKTETEEMAVPVQQIIDESYGTENMDEQETEEVFETEFSAAKNDNELLETETEKKGIIDQILSRPVLFAIPVIIVALLIILMVALRRKNEVETEEETEFEGYKPSFSGDIGQPGTTQLLDEGDGKTISGSKLGETVLLFDDTGFVLSSVAYPDKKWNLKNGENLIGRREELNDISFPEDKTVSGRHCRIFKKDGEFYLEDMKSSNGTKLNGKTISSAELIHEGDKIQIGRTELKVERKWEF